MIEKKLSPLIESLFPSHYRENGQNFVAFVKAYYEFLEENFQILKLKSYDGFQVGNVIVQGDTTGTIVAFVDGGILVHVDGFNTFKCVTMCSQLIPVVSNGYSTTVVEGGVSGRLGAQFWSRRLEEIGDVDQTLDLFIVKFKEKYLKNIDFSAKTNKALLIKNSLDLYRSKGTERSIDLFFRLVYGSSADVYYPSKDLFKLSDAEWYKPQYLEVYTPNTSRIIDLIGKQIEGVTTGSTAFVERYIKRKVQGGFVHILYISNVVGSFLAEELIKSGDLFVDSPKITGSLNRVTVTSGSTEFEVGSLVDVYSSTGSKAIGRVTEVNGERGVVRFQLIDGGWGFSLTANSDPKYTVAETADIVLTINNVVSSNTNGTQFQLFEFVTQPVAEIFYTGTYEFEANAAITVRNGGTVVNTGFIKDQDVGISSNGTIVAILTQPYNIANTYTVSLSANSASNVVVTNAYNISAMGKVIKSPTNAIVTVANTSLSPVFNIGDQIYQTTAGVEIANGIVVDSNVSPTGGTITLSDVNGVFKSQSATNRNSGSIAAVTSLSTTVGLFQANNTFYAGYGARSSHSNTSCVVSTASVGSLADFDVAVLDNESAVVVDSRLLSTFANDALSAWETSLYSVADMQQVTVGSIFALGGINPGSGYTAVPPTLVIHCGIAALDKTDFTLTVANTQGTFIIGEKVQQTQQERQGTFTIGNTSNFIVGEQVHVGNSVIEYAANGIVYSKSATVLTLNDLTGSWASDHRVTRFANSQQNSTFSASTDSNANVTVKGTISAINDVTLTVKRNELYREFAFDTVTGSIGGATATVIGVTELDTAPIGFNADVSSEVYTANGTIVEMQIVDSGFGFANNQTAAFASNGRVGAVTGYVTGVGVGSGSYRSSGGFLSDVSKLQDGDYWQEYSYDVISRVPFNLYKDMFNQVMHTAGMRFFGNLLIDSSASIGVSVANTEIDLDVYSAFVLSSNTSVIIERDGDEVTLRP